MWEQNWVWWPIQHKPNENDKSSKKLKSKLQEKIETTEETPKELKQDSNDKLDHVNQELVATFVFKV